MNHINLVSITQICQYWTQYNNETAASYYLTDNQYPTIPTGAKSSLHYISNYLNSIMVSIRYPHVVCTLIEFDPHKVIYRYEYMTMHPFHT